MLLADYCVRNQSHRLVDLDMVNQQSVLEETITGLGGDEH